MEILIGSGFAELIDKNNLLSGRFNRGNDLQTLKKINSENFFLNLKNKGINIPAWSKKKSYSNEWLIKSFKSFGGVLVRKNAKNSFLKSDEYFQKKIFGEHLSLQFFIHDKRVKVLSVCNQFFKEDFHKPFVIKGIITRYTEPKLMKKLTEICCKISKSYNHNGINNLELILEKNSEKIYIIELNGRPGLSTNLIFRIHKNIFKYKRFQTNQDTIRNFYGTEIIYSNKTLLIDKQRFQFIQSLKNCPSFSELPRKNLKINKNEPICLIHLQSKNKKNLKKKLKKLSYKILNNLD